MLAGRCYHDQEVAVGHDRLIQALKIAHGWTNEPHNQDEFNDSTNKTIPSSLSPKQQNKAAVTMAFSKEMSMVESSEDSPREESRTYGVEALKRQLDIIDESVRLGNIAGFFQG